MARVEVQRFCDMFKGATSAETVACLKCGAPVLLWWNGGELDGKTCCGLWYSAEHVRTDIVVYQDARPTNPPTEG